MSLGGLRNVTDSVAIRLCVAIGISRLSCIRFRGRTRGINRGQRSPCQIRGITRQFRGEDSMEKNVVSKVRPGARLVRAGVIAVSLGVLAVAGCSSENATPSPSTPPANVNFQLDKCQLI